MNRIALLPVVFSLALTALLRAEEDPGAIIKASIESYENDVRANTLKMIAAKTEEEKEVFRRSVPSASPVAKQVMEVVNANLKAKGTEFGVNWLVTQASAFPEGQEAIQVLGKNYIEASGVAQALKALEYHPFEVAQPILLSVLDNNKNEPELAAANYAMGMQHFRRFESMPDPKEAESEKAKAMDYFQSVADKYSKTTINGFPIADQAGRTMFELQNLSVGSPCPAIDGKMLDGSPISLKDYSKQYVILVFWGGWCHACHGLIPELNNLMKKAKNEEANYVVLGINTDIPEEANKAFETYSVSFPNLSDGTTSGPVTSMFNLRSFPTVYLLAPGGEILLKNSHIEAAKQVLAEKLKLTF